MNLKNTSFCLIAVISLMTANLTFGATQSQSPTLTISATIPSIFNIPAQFPDPSNTEPILDLEQHPENYINRTITISYAPGSTTASPADFNVYSNSDQGITITQTGNARLQRPNDSTNVIPFQIQYVPCNNTSQQVININSAPCNTSGGCQIPLNSSTWTACNTSSSGYIMYVLTTPNKILPPGEYSVAPGYSVTFQADF